MNGLHARVGAVHLGPWRPAKGAMPATLDALRRRSILLRVLAWLRRLPRL